VHLLRLSPAAGRVAGPAPAAADATGRRVNAVLGLLLALVCLAVGFAFGAVVVHVGHLAQRLQPEPPAVPEPTVEVDAAMGLHELARLVVLLEQLDPSYTRRVVDDMKHASVLAIYLHAAIAAIIATPGMATRIRADADLLMADKAWDLPPAERPERES